MNRFGDLRIYFNYLHFFIDFFMLLYLQYLVDIDKTKKKKVSTTVHIISPLFDHRVSVRFRLGRRQTGHNQKIITSVDFMGFFSLRNYARRHLNRRAFLTGTAVVGGSLHGAPAPHLIQTWPPRPTYRASLPDRTRFPQIQAFKKNNLNHIYSRNIHASFKIFNRFRENLVSNAILYYL